MITLRFEIVDSELDLKFFKKVVVSESQFDLSRFDLADLVAEDLKKTVIAKWRSKRRAEHAPS